MDAENTVCELTPSQLVNLKSFVVAGAIFIAIVVTWIITKWDPALFFLLLPAAYAFWKYLEVDHTKLKITDQRIIMSEGIFNKKTNETELYRVRDSTIEEPFLYRICGLGNIVVYTTDDAEGLLHFKAYKKPHWVKDQVRNNAEACRQKRRWGNDNIILHDHIE